MISIVDKHVASKTLLLKRVSSNSCLVNLIWKENSLLLFYNLELDENLKVLSFEMLLDDDEVVCIKEIIKKHIENNT